MSREIGPSLRIEFQPSGKRIDVTPKTNLLQATRQAGFDLAVVCGGVGTCGSCRVKVVKGKISNPTSEEKSKISAFLLSKRYRLACQAIPEGDCVVEIPIQSLSTPQRTQSEGKEFQTTLDPVIKSLEFSLPPPSMTDLLSDSNRLIKNIGSDSGIKMEIPYPVAKELSPTLRKNQWSGKLVFRETGKLGTIVSIFPRKSKIVGLAVDIGTTKLAMYLVDLESGLTLAQIGDMNPQISYGEDVISRIAYCDKYADGRTHLQQVLITKLNEMTAKCCKTAGIESSKIVDGVFVGNTAMHHLVCGFPVKQLGEAPYVASVSDAVSIPAIDLGLIINRGANIYFPPVVAGFVGADHISMLLATDAWKARETTVALDIGTNTEIALIHEGKIFCCSCASGPAFEGAHISSGMRAAKGAIERVQYENGHFDFKTIDNKPPIGICGSGILDAICAMKISGVADRRGALLKNHPFVGTNGFQLVPADKSKTGEPIFITRADVHQIQLAKGAIRAGWQTLLAHRNLTEKDIKRFIVAGAFGTYLRVESAVEIGMFPDLPLEKFQQVGNAAGMGAKGLLINSRLRDRATKIIEEITYLELNNQSNFMNTYIQSLFL
jgi:uncharacterized 2Fe-2S/4Fe-4S cluster protein (DUF4445 family)